MRMDNINVCSMQISYANLRLSTPNEKKSVWQISEWFELRVFCMTMHNKDLQMYSMAHYYYYDYLETQQSLDFDRHASFAIEDLLHCTIYSINYIFFLYE